MHASKSCNRWGKWRDIRVKDWRRNVTAHRQMKTHIEALISAGKEKNIQIQLEPTSFFPLEE